MEEDTERVLEVTGDMVDCGKRLKDDKVTERYLDRKLFKLDLILKAVTALEKQLEKKVSSVVNENGL